MKSFVSTVQNRFFNYKSGCNSSYFILSLSNIIGCIIYTSSSVYFWYTFELMLCYFIVMGEFISWRATWSEFPRATKALCLIMSLMQKSTGNVIWLSITVIAGACEACGSCKNSCNPGLLSLWPSHVFLKPINGIFRAWKLDGSNINLNILNDTGSLGSAFYNNI